MSGDREFMLKIASLGGLATTKKYSIAKRRKWGKLGGRPKKVESHSGSFAK